MRYDSKILPAIALLYAFFVSYAEDATRIIDPGKSKDFVESPANGGNVLSRIEGRYPNSITRGNDGHLVGLSIPYEYSTDADLKYLSEINFKELTVFISPHNTNLTHIGIAALAQMAGLRSLALKCSKTLKPGLLKAACNLTNLESLTIDSAIPPTDEYPYLTNLVHLKALFLYGVPNFRDAELRKLEALPELEHLTLSDAKLQKGWTNLANRFPSITNITLFQNETIFSWAKRK